MGFLVKWFPLELLCDQQDKTCASRVQVEKHVAPVYEYETDNIH